MSESGFDQEFVAMRCPQCGGEVKITREQQDDFFMAGEGGSFVFIGSGQGEEQISCQHCGTKFVRKGKYQPHSGGNRNTVVGQGNIQIGGNAEGFIGVTGSGNFVSAVMPRRRR